MTIRAVVTVGTFDGVHVGHQAVLAEIAQRAQAQGLKSVLVTFEPHPLEVVNPGAAPLLLTLPDEKRAILAQTPVDHVVFLRFSEEMRRLSPEAFVRDVLEARLHVVELVIGYDHGFGRDRAGDVALLRRIGAADGFRVDVVPAVQVDGRAVSSTAIRRAVTGGDLTAAAKGLGRRYSVAGTVSAGAGRGRTIGVPTANILPPSPRKLLPPDGVYACEVSWPAGRRGAMVNLGGRPTFGETGRMLEAHLFDFDGDLYGQVVQVDFVQRLRDTVRFGSVSELEAQLVRDRDAALAALRTGTGPVNL